MKLIYELLMITAIVAFGIDVAGFMESVKAGLSRWLGLPVRSLKPFDCSLCSTWWCCLLWTLCTGRFSLEGVALSAACALLAGPIGQAEDTAVQVLEALVHAVRALVEKLMRL